MHFQLKAPGQADASILPFDPFDLLRGNLPKETYLLLLQKLAVPIIYNR